MGAKVMLPHTFNVWSFILGATTLGLGIWFSVVSTQYDLAPLQTSSLNYTYTTWISAVNVYISAGAIFLAAAILGGPAVHRRSPLLLKLYMLFGFTAVVLEITAASLGAVVDDNVDISLRTDMKTHLQTFYENPEQVTKPTSNSPQEDTSYNWNLMQSEWFCCGSSGYEDYYGVNFTKNNEPAITVVPFECCVRQEGVPSSDMNIDNVLNYTACQLEANTTCTGLGSCPNLYKQGCYLVYLNQSEYFTDIIMGTGFAFGIFMLICFIMLHAFVKDLKMALMSREMIV